MIVAEDSAHVVVEMNLQPSETPDLHQLLTVKADRVVRIQDFPDRETTLAAGGLDA
jgi:hypothetical protein